MPQKRCRDRHTLMRKIKQRQCQENSRQRNRKNIRVKKIIENVSAKMKKQHKENYSYSGKSFFL